MIHIKKTSREKKVKKNDAPKGSKNRKIHSSSKGEKKVIQVEDTLDPLIAPPELFGPETNEVVVAFKDSVPKSFYDKYNLLSWRLNVFFY